MGYHSTDRQAGLIVGRARYAVLLATWLVTGCDSGPAELAREIDAAREGCTEEMLKAGDEECVRMFETYADMAADAMETYIGGMRAFDEAIQRRGGLQFDTAGLGNALGDGWRGTLDSIGGAPRPYPAAGGADPRQLGYGPLTEPYGENAYGSVTGGRWSDPVPGGGIPLEGYPPAGAATGGGTTSAPSAGRPTTPRRGVLLPPEERLRRPWIDDAGVDDRYVEGAPTGQTGRTPNGQASGWYPYPGGSQGGYPYPYGAPGGYPSQYGTPGGYPSPYGVPGGDPYPYGASGAYPYPYGAPGGYPYQDAGVGDPYYPEPQPGEYPYPDTRRGGR